MKRRMLAILLTLCMILGMMPAVGYADEVGLPDTPPNAEVENLGITTLNTYCVWPEWNTKITDNPMELQVAMSFTALDDDETVQNNPWKDFWADFYIEFNGLAGDTLNPEGCYLAGEYGSFGWILIPVDDLGITINGDIKYPVTSTFFDWLTYEAICTQVGTFNCGIYIPEETIEANPNMSVTLSLALSSTHEKAMSADYDQLVGEPYTYTADDMLGKFVAVTDSEGNAKRYKLLNDAAASANSDDKIEILVDEYKVTEDVTMTYGEIVGKIHNANYETTHEESDDTSDGERFYAPYQNKINSYNILMGTESTPASITLDGSITGAKTSLLSGDLTVKNGAGLYGSDAKYKSWMNVNVNGGYTFGVGNLLVYNTDNNISVSFDGENPIAQLDLESGAEMARFGHIYVGSDQHDKGENAYIMNVDEGAELKDFAQLTTRGDGTVNVNGTVRGMSTKSYQSSSQNASSMHENAKDGAHSNNNGVINVSETGSIELDSMNIGRKSGLGTGNAELNVNGGSVTFSNYINVGYDSSARIGEINLSDGAKLVSEFTTYTLKYNNGSEAGTTTVTKPAGTLTVGVAATGIVNMDTESSISVGKLNIGEHGSIVIDAAAHVGDIKKIIEQTSEGALSLEGKVTINNLPATHYVEYTDGDVTLVPYDAVVTFAYNNGEENTTQSAICSTKISAPTAPTRSGYTFGGWYTDEACTSAYDFETLVTGDITLYAKWTKNAAPSRPSSGSSSSSTTTTTPVVSTDDKTEENVAGDKVTTTETTAKPEATVTGSTAKTEIDNSVADQIVEQATKNESHEVVIAPEVSKSEEVSKTEVTISSETVEKIGTETNANLTVSTPVADVAIANEGLNELAKEGEKVTVSAEKKEDTIVVEVKTDDKNVDKISGGVTVTVPVEEASAGTVAVIVHEDGTEEVVRQTVAADGTVSIPLEGSATIKIVDNSKTFDDVKEDDWHSDAVDFASSRELFNGTSATTFSPSGDMTRGMLAVVLHNLESNPEHDHEHDFDDVHEARYYDNAVAWAAGEGLVSGYGNGDFGPDDHITREQLAVILWKYAGCPESDHELDHFDDEANIAGYAKAALAWANEHKIINGKGGAKLDPTGNATRAEVAQMLKNFMENVK